MLWTEDKHLIMEEVSRKWRIDMAVADLISTHLQFSDEGDLHVCGYCKQSFPRLDKWLEHKQLQWCKSVYHQPTGSRATLSSVLHTQHLVQSSGGGMAPDRGASLISRPVHHQDPPADHNQPTDLTTSVKTEAMEVTGPGGDMTVSRPAQLSGGFSVPIKKTMYPIMPHNRRSHRGSRRKQDSPQPLIKLEESPPTPSYSDSAVPASPGYEEVGPEVSWYQPKRPRPNSTSETGNTSASPHIASRPVGLGLRKDKAVPGMISTPGTSSPGVASVSSSSAPLFSPEHANNQSEVSHPRRPLVLPRVYSCPRCSKSFIKLSHLHRHMNKKKPCEAKDSSDMMDDNSDPEEIVSMPSQVLFTCGLCSEQCRSYDEIIAHHSEKHPAYYPGYCKFCGKFQDRKNKLLIHLVKHDHSQIVDEVAQEVKRIRHTKIDKPTATAASHHLTAAASPVASSGVSAAHQSAAALFGSPLTLPPHQLSTLSVLSAAHSSAAALSAVSSQYNSEVLCPCCKSKLPDRDELLYHFRDYHQPLGCFASDNEILEASAATEDKDLPASDSALLQNTPDSYHCFMCCLRFRDKEAFQQHTDYHKVWSERVPPVIANGSPEPETSQRYDENRNQTNKSAEIIRDTDDQLADESNNNHGGDRVIDLSMGSKKIERKRVSISSAGSNGSPMETVALDYPCWLCTDQHSDMESLRDHVSGAHKLHLLFRCVSEDCRKEFDTWQGLHEHHLQHDQKCFVCKVCNDHQSSHVTLNNHSLSHQSTKSLPAVCGYCQCLVEENMELHRIKCLQEYIACPECNEKVKRLAMMKHMLNHSAMSGKSYKCDQCESVFPLRDRLNQHVKNVHGPRKFVCTDCGAAFKRNDKLQRHCQSRHSDVKPYLCPIVSCGRAFKRIDGLRAHVRCSHVSESLASLVKTSHGCTVCGKLVAGQDKLVDHLMSHVKANPPAVSSSSSLSGELYGGSHDLADEQSQQHQGSLQGHQQHFQCPQCHIKIANESLFYAHLVQHSQVAFQSSALPFPPGFFFMGQNAALPNPKSD